MNRHLSSEQVSEWLLGERQPEIENHFHDCAECRAEVAQLGNALAEFRGAVRESSAGFQIANRKRGAAWMSAASVKSLWAAAAFTAVLAIVGVSALPHAPRAGVPENAITDAMLLSRIDTELSRAVPCPMEPLTKLVAWEGATTDSEKQ
ncbi:MAG: hypothetical protein M3Y07_06710 [Acidobacteriota bacterium]|nr:hypothetical protein [Acidobacteriota bacterium]